VKKLIIKGGQLLEGEVHISGSKNSALPIICASLLCQEFVKLFNCPDIEDVNRLLDILRELHVDIKREADYIEINSHSLKNIAINSANVSKLRASYYLMGVYLALFNHVQINMPGGCDLGSRPIDLHLKAFRLLNGKCEVNYDQVLIDSKKLKGNKIFFEIPSVGATINAMLASVFIEGKTIIENAAKEPEIIDVANFLNKMGANITGAGSCIIEINGVKRLKGTEYYVMSDRIEAGTYALMAAGRGKEVDIVNFNHKYNNGFIAKLIESNVKFKILDNKIKILSSKDILPLNLKTGYYPGFPTDLQQIYLALLTQAKGISKVQDSIYKSRFKNCYELNKMGARIIVDENVATIYGPHHLNGAEVTATDLRGGASLVLAGLMAEGTTTILNPEHIFRGYSGILEKIRKINGNITIA
jgi:UDP-N-acetylglucosamine 1-carboxyvinyltransferase